MQNSMQLCHLFMKAIFSVCIDLNSDLRMGKEVGTILLLNRMGIFGFF